MDITAQFKVDDYSMGRTWREHVHSITGSRLPLLWQEKPGLRCARLHNLERHLGEPVRLDPEEWLWWQHGRESYGRDCREFITRMPQGQDMAWIELYRRDRGVPTIMIIRWCIGGRLESSGLDPIFEWAISKIELTEMQSRRLLWWEGEGSPRLVDL